jgi:uncharacterized protein YbcI
LHRPSRRPTGRRERAFADGGDAWLPRPPTALLDLNTNEATAIRDRLQTPGEAVGGARLPPPAAEVQLRAREANIRGTSEQQSRQANIERPAVSDAGPSEPPCGDSALRPLAGGRLLSEITNRIVSLMREHYGRGPIKAKTYVLDNLIVCVLSDGGFTAIERTMMGGGEPERVLEMRRDFQRMMKVRYSEMIEAFTGRKVLAFLSQAHVEPDLTVEMFLMDAPLAGFGALELADLGDG